MFITKPKENSILRQLMQEAGLSEAGLARQANVPQTTINRLLNSDVDPRANTLRPIAQYFGITIGQLLGDEPLSPHRIKGATSPHSRSAWRALPIIEWSQVAGWRFRYQQVTPLTHHQWIISERDMGDQSFALLSRPYMEPRFRKNSVLLIDPQVSPEDGHFILVAIETNEPTVRRVLHDGNQILLEHLRAGQANEILDHSMVVYGVIVESRLDYVDVFDKNTRFNPFRWT